MQKGVRVTSTNRTGSQKDTGNPIRGMGVPQAQMGVRGLWVSSPEEETGIPPIVMGNRHDQHTSVMGLTNFPTHLAWAVVMVRRMANDAVINERSMLFLDQTMKEEKHENRNRFAR